jgi:hypothetical protein
MAWFPWQASSVVCLSVLAGACNGWTDEAVIQVRDPSQVTVRPANRDPRRGEIPAGRGPALMKAVDADPASIWLARRPDASISSFGTLPNLSDMSIGVHGAPEVELNVVLSAQGELHLAPENRPRFRLSDVSRDPNRVVQFPATLGRVVLTKWDTKTTQNTDGSSTTTTREEYASARDDVIFSSPASNLERGYYYSRPSRVSGAVWLIGGLLFDGLGLYVLQKGKGAKHAGTLHEDAMPVIYSITGAFFAIGLPFEAYGSYLLLAPEKRTLLP